MHQRTWLSILTLPLVVGFTYPMLASRGQQVPAVQAAPSNQDPLAGLADIQDVLSLVRDNYVDPVDMGKVIAGGIQGALERAHPLNAYLTPEELRLPDPGPADLGIRLLKRGIFAVVLSVAPGGPGEAGGLLTGDVIRKIDGMPVSSMTQAMVEFRLRGKAGSSAALLRYSVVTGETKTMNLTRAILGRSPLSLTKVQGANVVAFPDLEPGRTEELRKLMSGHGAGETVLLDLRKTFGGTFEEAAKLGALVGMTGTCGTIQESGKAERVMPFDGSTQPLPGKWVALTSGGTAGPVELVVSALKKAKAPTYGDRTAALGVALRQVNLKSGGAVRLVYQRWMAVGGERLDRQGVLPATQLRGLRPDEDPIPKLLEHLAQPDVQKKAWALPMPNLKDGRFAEEPA